MPLIGLDLQRFDTNSTFYQEAFSLPQEVMNPVLAGLTFLAVRLVETDHSTFPASRTAVANIFQSAKNLKRLRVRLDTYMLPGDSDLWQFLTIHLASRSLESIELRGVRVSKELLMRFLQEQKGSLQSLHLDSVILHDEDDWRFVLRYLANSHELRWISLKNLLLRNPPKAMAHVNSQKFCGPLQASPVAM